MELGGLSMTSRALRAAALRRYHADGQRWQLDRAVGRVEGRRRLHPAPDPAPIAVPELASGRLLTSTSAAGLLLIDRGKMARLLPGSFYGLTRHRDGWLAFERQRFGGRILGFRLDGARLKDLRVRWWGFSPGVHQIDVFDGELWVTDTYNNRLLRYRLDGPVTGRSWRSYDRCHYPAGHLHQGRSSPNYQHLNSVLGTPGAVYVVAHNETTKTGRPSVLLRLGHEGTVEEEIPLGSSNAHNVVAVGDGAERRLLTCASMEGTLREDDCDVYRTASLTRGLAVGPELIALGSSPIAERRERADVDSTVTILTRDYQLVTSFSVPRTQIHELRFVDVPDLGMSATERKESHASPGR